MSGCTSKPKNTAIAVSSQQSYENYAFTQSEKYTVPYTIGYPFLVSRICQCIDEELGKNGYRVRVSVFVFRSEVTGEAQSPITGSHCLQRSCQDSP